MKKQLFFRSAIFALALLPFPVLGQRVIVFNDDEGSYVYPGPDSGIPSPSGNCAGSGCSFTPQGQGFGANTPKDEGAPQYPSRQGGDTNFRTGSLDFGPSWSNGGYLGSVISPSFPSDDIMVKYRLSQTQVITSVTADNVFPRQQILSDLEMLEQVLSGLYYDKVINRYPRILAPLPPTVAQINQLSDDIFEKNIGPIRDGGKVRTDWDQWRLDLRSKTVQPLIDIAWQRDLALGDAYLAAIKHAVDAQEVVVAVKAKSLFGEANNPPPLYKSPLRSACARSLETIRDAEMLVSMELAEPFEPRRTQDIERNKNYELIKRSAGIVPPLPQGGIARMLADLAIMESEYAFSEGQVAEAILMQEIAIRLLDVSISFVPVAGQGVAIYEYITGRSFVNGEEISPEQRTIMGVVLASTFLRASAPAALKALDRFRREADAINRGASDVLAVAGKRAGIKELATDRRVVDFREITGIRQGAEHNADAAIARGKRLSSDRRPWATDRVTYEPAWQASELVVDGKTAVPVRLVRLHNGSNRNGAWLAAEADVANLSGKELRNRFNLPSTPTLRSDVTLPAGTQIRYGRVGKNSFGVSEGALQIEVFPGTLRDEWFSPAIPLQ